MQLVTHHSDHGQHIALVIKTGRKWIQVLYVGAVRYKKLPLSEVKFFRHEGEATAKQIKQFNRASRKFGANKKMVSA